MMTARTATAVRSLRSERPPIPCPCVVVPIHTQHDVMRQRDPLHTVSPALGSWWSWSVQASPRHRREEGQD
jgi:hypothetical protein